MSNIDDERRIIKGEAFVYDGKERVRRAGQRVPNLMRQWVELRRKSAEARISNQWLKC